jgi:tetratricopeptide (TPR) repeat protein
MEHAIEVYRKVLKLEPDYKDAIYSLGVLYHIKNDKVSALRLVPKLTRLDKGLGDELNLLVEKVK